jgi:hypothetical protein
MSAGGPKRLIDGRYEILHEIGRSNAVVFLVLLASLPGAVLVAIDGTSPASRGWCTIGWIWFQSA